MKITNEKLWGNLSMALVLIYVTIGGGYELITGIQNHHIKTSFVFVFLSSLIFVSRVLYAMSSGAKRTLWADLYGAAVMIAISILHLILN